MTAGVDFRVAGNFAILSKTGITDVCKSTITGDIGTIPITGAALLVIKKEAVARQPFVMLLSNIFQQWSNK